MPNINKGRLRLGEVVIRQAGNDWPTAQVITTQDVIEVSSNLYFTNARVSSAIAGANLIVGNIISLADITAYGNLVANGLVIRNIVVPDSALLGTTSATDIVANSITANTWVRLYSANVIESDTNLFYTNSRARTAYTAGTGIAISQGGVISYKQADPGLGFYNSGLTLASAAVVSNIYSNVVTFNSADGVNFIVQSLHVTNLSPNTVYLNGRINHNYSSLSNSVVFANLLELPGSTSTELFLKPSTFKVGDQIQLQSFSSPTQPANNLISAMVSYQGSAITEYDRAGFSLTSNSMANIFTSVGKSAILESVKVVNPNPTPGTVTVSIVNDTGATFAFLASNLTIPAFSTIEVCEYPKTLLTDYTLRAQKTIGYGQPINIFTSSKYTSYFLATPSSSTIGEAAGSNIITIDFQTLGVTNGTTFYYSIDGNVQPSDFVPAANTGSFVVTGDQGTISLQLAADTGFEGEESFRVQVRKASVTGTIVSTTSNIIVKDTANTEYVLVTSSTSSANEGNTITFTVTVYNPTTSTYYYTTKNMAGNVFAPRFSTANTGAITITSSGGSNTISLVANADGITNGDGIFQLDIRTGSTSGTIANTSANVIIYDTSQFGLFATGGTVITEGNFKVHVFTSSNTFAVTGLGTNNQIQYAVIGGGGAAVGGGGGAGGLLQGTTTIPAAGNYSVIVGGGGSVSVPSPSTNFASSGTVSELKSQSNTFNISAMGGGYGSVWEWPGQPGYGSGAGGSGGGGRTSPGPLGTLAGPGGSSMPGQGYPGGNAPGGGGSQYAGGGGGAGGAGSPTQFVPGPGAAYASGGIGAGVPIAPPAYGTTGNATITARMFAGGGEGYMGWPAGTGFNFGSMGGGGNIVGGAAVVNSGGGGGGFSPGPSGGSQGQGGSGIVIIKYRFQ